MLFSAVAATRRERVREGVLLKTLGATQGQIRRILFAEYALLGVLGSLTGMLLSFGGRGILRFVFHRPFSPATLPAVLIAAAMVLVTVSIGVLSGRDVFKTTPMAALRGSVTTERGFHPQQPVPANSNQRFAFVVSSA